MGSSESGSPTSISAKANSMMVRTVAMDVLIHFERRTPSQPGPAGPMGSPQVHGPQGRAHTHTDNAREYGCTPSWRTGASSDSADAPPRRGGFFLHDRMMGVTRRFQVLLIRGSLQARNTTRDGVSRLVRTVAMDPLTARDGVSRLVRTVAMNLLIQRRLQAKDPSSIP